MGIAGRIGAHRRAVSSSLSRPERTLRSTSGPFADLPDRPSGCFLDQALSSVRDERDVLAGLGMDRTRRLAGEVPLEPVVADVGHGRYLAISKSAAVGPATVTAFCVAFSFGCHTFTV
jgi:hypothetical protein